MLGTVHRQTIGVVTVVGRKSPDAARRKEFTLVQHNLQHLPQLIAIHNGEQTPLASPRGAHACHVADQVRAVINKPLQASLEVGQPLQHLGFQSLDGE